MAAEAKESLEDMTEKASEVLGEASEHLAPQCLQAHNLRQVLVYQCLN